MKTFTFLILLIISSTANAEKYVDVCDKGDVGAKIVKILKAKSCKQVPESGLKNPEVSFLLMSSIKADIEAKGANFVNVCDRGIIGKQIVKQTSASDCKKVPDKSMATIFVLELQNTGLTSIPKNAFQGLVKLKTLDLSGNQLTSIPANSFEGLPKLKELILSKNKIKSISADAFNGLENVSRIHLDGNEFTSFEANTFHGLEDLKNVHLDSAQKANIPSLKNTGASSDAAIYGPVN